MQSETEAEKDEIFCHLLKKGLGGRGGGSACPLPSQPAMVLAPGPSKMGRVWGCWLFFFFRLKKKKIGKKKKGEINLKKGNPPKAKRTVGCLLLTPGEAAPLL